MTHVAYKGGNPAQLDLMAGNVDMMITQPNSRDLVTTGKMRALAVSSARRSSFYPELPTVAEAGVPGYQSVAWYGLVGPKGMPAELVKKIADEARRAAATEGAKSVVAQQGGDMVASTPAEFAAFIEAERSALRDHRARRRHDGRLTHTTDANCDVPEFPNSVA